MRFCDEPDAIANREWMSQGGRRLGCARIFNSVRLAENGVRRVTWAPLRRKRRRRVSAAVFALAIESPLEGGLAGFSTSTRRS